MPDKTPPSWDAFANEVARLASATTGVVSRSSRLIEDLGLDSLGLTELVAYLVDRHGATKLAADLELRRWENTTAGDLFDECFPSQSQAGDRAAD